MKNSRLEYRLNNISKMFPQKKNNQAINKEELNSAIKQFSEETCGQLTIEKLKGYVGCDISKLPGDELVMLSEFLKMIPLESRVENV